MFDTAILRCPTCGLVLYPTLTSCLVAQQLTLALLRPEQAPKTKFEAALSAALQHHKAPSPLIVLRIPEAVAATESGIVRGRISY